jgi:hypothetical protein
LPRGAYTLHPSRSHSLSLQKRNPLLRLRYALYNLTQDKNLIIRPPSFLFCFYPMVYCRFSPTEPLSWFHDRTPAVLFSKQKKNGVTSSTLLRL